MGKFKQFLFGLLTGSAVIFFAFQYHVIQTQEGFRVVPRTPQQSLAQAYVDMRNWGPKDAAEQPSVTRALVANGLSDLVVGSVSNDLMNSVTSEGSMGQFRESLNEFSNPQKSDSLFGPDDFKVIRKESGSNARQDELLEIPFDHDVRNPRWDRKVSETPPARTSVAQRAGASIEDVFRSGNAGSSGFQESSSDDFSRSAGPSNFGTSATDEINRLEDMLFSNEPSQATPATTPKPNTDSSGYGIFEDVTSALEDRADQALDRARNGFRNEVNRTLQDSTDTASRFARGKIKESVPDSISSMFPDNFTNAAKPSGNSSLPSAIQALQNGFDPFIE